MINIKLTGNSYSVFQKINRIANNIDRFGTIGLQHCGKVVKKDIKDSFRASKSGKKYASLPNRSSARGQPPAIQLGNLDNSISFATKGGNKLIIGAGSSSTNSNGFDYAKFWELNKKERRQYLRPALDNRQGYIRKYLQKEIIKILKK